MPQTRRTLLVVTAVVVGGMWFLASRSAYPHDPITTTVLFNREVVRIFERKCVQCHATNTLSMPLTNYREARPWAQAIKEEVLERRMPPWPAVSGYGRFSNENSLTTREVEYLVSWIDGGVPPGAGPGSVTVLDVPDWPHGTPDLVLTMPAPHVVPADVKDDATRVVIPSGLRTARWIRSVDFKPGDRRVVKSAFFYDAGSGEWLGAWTPWHASLQLPDNVGFLLPAGARIEMEIHYHGVEAQVEDTSAVGLHFATQPPARRASGFTVRLEPRAPEDDESLRLQDRKEVTEDLFGIALRAELSAGGRSVEVAAIKPDGTTEMLLFESPYQSEWPTPYIFREPVALPRGTQIVTTAYFDRVEPAGLRSLGRVILTYISRGEILKGAPNHKRVLSVL